MQDNLPELMGRMELDNPSAEPFPGPEDQEEVEQPAARVKGRRRPQAKGPIQDDSTEVTGPVMRAWNSNYLKNMEIAKKQKDTRRANRIARDNAKVWVLDHGFTGLLHNPMLKELFSGQAFYDRFNKSRREGDGAGRGKRGLERSLSEEPIDGKRRVRPRLQGEDQEKEIGRGMDGLELIPPSEHPGTDDMEIGRDVPVTLPEDVQSLHSDIPWVSAAGHSDHIFSVGGVVSSSIGGRSAVGSSPMQSRAVRAGSRLSVAGSALGNLPEVDEDNLPRSDFSAEKFDFFGPGTWQSCACENCGLLMVAPGTNVDAQDADREKSSFELLECVFRDPPLKSSGH
jgi:hypothetical protein